MRFHRTLKTLGGLLGALSRSNVAFHFDSDDATRAHFRDQGFAALTVHDPADYYSRLPIPAPTARRWCGFWRRRRRSKQPGCFAARPEPV